MITEQLVFAHKQRMCIAPDAPKGDGGTAALQLDAVLMSIGFKCSADLLAALGGLDRSYVITKAVDVLTWARELAGDHRRHNAYFIDFPANVPDTETFIGGLLRDAVMAAVGGEVSQVRVVLGPDGVFALDLLSLPGYGSYQHSYEGMVERHRAFEPLLRDKYKIVHRGADVETEAAALLAEMLGSKVPLSGDRLEELRFLASGWAPLGPVAYEVPVRENLAVLNVARAKAGMAMHVTTVTDVLRAAAEASGSDVTLAGRVQFRGIRRVIRTELMRGLQTVLTAHREQTADIPPRAELWKRLGERLHPHEYPEFPEAQRVFAIARGETDILSRAAQFERLMTAGKPGLAAARLAPGELWRQADRLLRAPQDPAKPSAVLTSLVGAMPHVSARVLLSMRQHLANRAVQGGPRVFVNRRGRSWTVADTRAPLSEAAVHMLGEFIDAEMRERLPKGRAYLVDAAVLGAALPLSGKNTSEGLGVWPRGSVSKLDAAEWLRFFFYWHQASRRTDYDLSVQFLDSQFRMTDQISYTNLRAGGLGEHSGDITSAPDGATEFINIRLGGVPQGSVVVPQLYLFNGEGEKFSELQEHFFGFMTRDAEQQGRPFEPRSVRMRSVLPGDHRVSMPVAFFRGEDGAWYAKWLHLGSVSTDTWGNFARVEENKVTTGLLARSFMSYQYLRVRYLYELLRAENMVITYKDGWQSLVREGDQVTFIGTERPDGLPEGTEVITLDNLAALIPA